MRQRSVEEDLGPEVMKVPEHHNRDEAEEKDPENKCMKMIETLIEVMRKCLKEMEEK